MSSSCHHPLGGASPFHHSGLKVGELMFSFIACLTLVHGLCVYTYLSLTTFPQRDTTAMKRISSPSGEGCVCFHQPENPREKVTGVLLLPRPLRSQGKHLAKAWGDFDLQCLGWVSFYYIKPVSLTTVCPHTASKESPQRLLFFGPLLLTKCCPTVIRLTD